MRPAGYMQPRQAILLNNLNMVVDNHSTWSETSNGSSTHSSSSNNDVNSSSSSTSSTTYTPGPLEVWLAKHQTPTPL